jgi:hypothetical protein
MKKQTKKELSWAQIDQKIHAYLHSANFRKLILLLLVVSTLAFDLAILSAGKNLFPKDQKAPENVANPWEKDVRELVKGSPMEVMTPYISQKEKKTAAFLVSIAKKESNWGKFSPKLNGKNCFNYWGYRGKGENVTPSGYTCFSSPRQAVNVVSRRMTELIRESNLDTPRKMAVWKCGWNCSWDNPEAVEKWIQDVDYYYQKFYE